MITSTIGVLSEAFMLVDKSNTNLDVARLSAVR